MSNHSSANDELLTPEQASELLQLDKRLLAVWRHRKVGPPYVQLSPRMPRYWRSAIDGWLAGQSVQTGSYRP